MTNYQDIITRLEAATGPDRELDVIIAYAVDYVIEDLSIVERIDRIGVKAMLDKVNGYGNIWKTLPRFTASLDASIALVERKLTGWQLVTWSGVEGYPCFTELRSCAPNLVIHEGKHDKLAIAVLLALFKALQAQENDK